MELSMHIVFTGEADGNYWSSDNDENLKIKHNLNDKKNKKAYFEFATLQT